MKKEMMKNVKKAVALTLAIAMGLSVGTVAGAKAKKPTLSKTKLTLNEGQTKKLTVKKNGNKIKKTTWSSTDKKKAKVSKKGVVTAVKAGNATIKAKVTVKASKNKTKKYTLKCKVTVKKSEVFPEGVWVTATDPGVAGTDVDKMFEEYDLSIVGVTYKPIAILAFNESSEGTIYRVFVKEVCATEPMTECYKIVEISRDSNEDPIIGSSYRYESETFPDAGEGLDGGWAQTDSPQIPKEEIEAFKMATKDITGVKITPIAKLAQQPVAGMRACYICESTVVAPVSDTAYSLVEVYVGNDGTTEFALRDIVTMGTKVPNLPDRNSAEWVKAETPEVDAVTAKYVEDATINESAVYTPIVMLAEKEQADCYDFRVLCLRAPKRFGAKTNYSILEVHTNLLGEAFVVQDIVSDMEAYGTDITALGTWKIPESPIINKSEYAWFDKAVEGIDGVYYSPIGIVATEKIRGTRYCFIATMNMVDPNSVEEYAFVTFDVDMDGNVSEAVIVDYLNA